MFHMRIGDENFNLFEIVNGKTDRVPRRTKSSNPSPAPT